MNPAPALTVLVLGGRGFIGRYAVRALRAAGHRVIIGSRFDAAETTAQLEQRRCRLQHLQRHEDWGPLLSGVDVVINCVGILRQRWGERYEAVHSAAPAALAQACAQLGLRMLHVSALGLHADAGSAFIRSKLAGERALLSSDADLTIVRPSLLDGRDGFGARWLRMLARMPVYLLPNSSNGRLACLRVEDLGEALARLATLPATELAALAPERVLEFGGPEQFVLRDYLHRLRGGERRSQVLGIPHWICRAFSHACDLLHLTPYSFGHLELLARDNCPQSNHLGAVLGREPTRIEAWNYVRKPVLKDAALPANVVNRNYVELSSDGFWSETRREEQGIASPMAATSNDVSGQKTLK